MRWFTAGHVVNHLLHLVALKVAANAVIDFAVGLDGTRILKLQKEKQNSLKNLRVRK